MARYLQTAKQANVIAQLVNLGVRCSPRGVQHTVRFNAVREAVAGLPVTVRMETRRDEVTGRTYNALVTTPTGGQSSAEMSSSDED